MMSNENETLKNDQIAHRLFTKFALVVDDARNVRTEAPRDDKWDKWVSHDLIILTGLAH